MTAGLDVRVITPPELRTITRGLQQLDGGKLVEREFKKALRRGVKPAQNKAKQAARRIYSSGKRHSGLRAKISRATQTQVRLTRDPTIRIRVKRSMLGDAENIPQRINREGVVRHPVFGDRDVWVDQQFPGSRGWFDNVMHQSGRDMQIALDATLKEFERRLK